MMKKFISSRRILSLIALGLVAFFSVPYAQEKTGMPERIDKVSTKDFDATFKAIEKTLKTKGFMIVATVDHQNMLTMVGTKIKGSKTIEFGKPEMGKMLLPMSPEVGLEMPGRFYIWERGDGKTVVSYYRPSVGFSKYGNEMIAKMGADMDGMWSMIVEEALK
jgi:uncharacterized protein (DUF302 family)